jgi:hypothetical protein
MVPGNRLYVVGSRRFPMANTKRKNEDSLVYDVPEAGAKLGLSRASAYEAAARGEIPTIKLGKLLKVPKVALDRMLAEAGTK